MRGVLLLAMVAGAALGQIPDEKEISLGRQIASEIEAHNRMVRDSGVVGFANRVLQKLSAGEALRLPLSIRVIDDPSIMVASALPGGILLISSGAILRSESEAEFAGLLAHAMAHAQIGLASGRSSGVDGGIPMIYVGGPWGACERSGGRGGQADLRESQADLLGLDYVVNGGYDPQALVSVVARWGGKLRTDSLMKTVTDPVVDSSAFEQMKGRLRAPAAAIRRPSLYR